MTNSPSRFPVAVLILAVIGFACLLVGVAGPWVLDDHINFANLIQWLNGDATWQAAVLDVQAGGLRRPLSHLSFLLNALVGGYAPVAFKLVNLALHMVCGASAFLLLRDLLTRVGPRPAAEAMAAIAVGVWLVLPIHVSTVLYPVQRMTLLSGLFSLLALLAYLKGRQQLSDDPVHARQLLFLAFPFFCLLSVLSKENGALTPLFAFLIEACFLLRATRVERRSVAIFFAIFLLLPLLAGLLLFAINPERWLNYSGREFGLVDRMLTQPVVLLEYLRAILLPLPQWLHLYREGYPIASLWVGFSAGLFWLSWTLSGVLLIRRRPLAAFGLLFFVAGHLIESTVLPLELYFEHRNYLPSLGLMLALVGLALPLLPGLPRERRGGPEVVSVSMHPRPMNHQTPAPPENLPPLRAGEGRGGGASKPVPHPALPRLTMIALLMLALLYALGTAHRAWQWRDLDRLMASEGPALPEISRRLQVDRAIRAFEGGRQQELERSLDVLATGNAGDRAAAAQWRAVFACDLGSFDSGHLQILSDAAPAVVTHNHTSYMSLLVRRVERGSCENLSAEGLLEAITTWRETSGQPADAHGPRQLATQQARLLLLSGDPAAALAALPEPRRSDFDAQLIRIRALIALNRKSDALDLISRLQASDRGWYRSRTQMLAQLAAAAR